MTSKTPAHHTAPALEASTCAISKTQLLQSTLAFTGGQFQLPYVLVVKSNRTTKRSDALDFDTISSHTLQSSHRVAVDGFYGVVLRTERQDVCFVHAAEANQLNYALCRISSSIQLDKQTACDWETLTLTPCTWNFATLQSCAHPLSG